MKKILSVVTLLVWAAGTLFADQAAETIANLMKNQPDAPVPQFNTRREMVGFWVVGVAPIPRSMPKNRAKAYARKAARRDAEKKVSQFFNTSVKMSETANGESVLTVAGEAAGDTGPAASKESSASIDRTSETFQKVSASAQSGLQGCGFDIRDGELVEVYKWSFAASKAIRAAAREMGKTADVSVKAANKVDQTRASGATEDSGSAEQQQQQQQVQQPIGAGANVAPANTTNIVSTPPPSDDFF